MEAISTDGNGLGERLSAASAEAPKRRFAADGEGDSTAMAEAETAGRDHSRGAEKPSVDPARKRRDPPRR